jgi:hypothetical protein
MIDLKLDNKKVWFAGVLIHNRCIFCLCYTNHYTDDLRHKGSRKVVCPDCAKIYEYKDILPTEIKNSKENRYQKVKPYIK